MRLHGLVLAAVFTLACAQPSLPGQPVVFTQDGQQRNGPVCDCYVVDGPDPGHFQGYRFWDFRRVPLDPAAAAGYQFYPTVNDQPVPYGPAAQPILLKDTAITKDWLIQDWHRPGSRLFPVSIANSEKNVFISRTPGSDSTFLVLRTKRLDQYSSTAEIATSFKSFLHVSMRVRLRILEKDFPILFPPAETQRLFVNTSATTPGEDSEASALRKRATALLPPPNGACAGIFTYFSRTSEADIEILTSDPPTRIHYANQPDYDPVLDQRIPGASQDWNIPIPWTTMATHRLDWFPDMTRWYLENQLQTTSVYSVPKDPSTVIINLWSDGGLWSGDLGVGETVHLAIEWIELAYNVTGPPAGPCNRKCRIDGVQFPGIPELVP
ncbi:hypothetical protein VTN31DRAFT_6409 [Thermomyces dupontii]|uniref:uncharacterized protein n=1 Tax=Talaromyces thermophilus TaxID=28565 RepID=UPI003742FD57